MSEKVFVAKFIDCVEDIRHKMRSNEEALEVLASRVAKGKEVFATFRFSEEGHRIVAEALGDVENRIEGRIQERENQARFEERLNSINF